MALAVLVLASLPTEFNSKLSSTNLSTAPTPFTSKASINFCGLSTLKFFCTFI